MYKDRLKMVKAMEFIVKSVNNEDYIDPWLCYGVADGDIEIGDLSINLTDYETLDYYIQDKEFSELMDLFLQIMNRARKDGGLYCDRVVSYKKGERNNG